MLRDFAFTAGRLWDEGKSITTLDRAAARLGIPFKAAGPIAGPNGQRAVLEHLHGLGSVEERVIAEYLSARPVFVSAPRYEPFGLAVLEAALAGCPLVLSDIPTFRELWNGAAIFVEPDDSAGFAAAIEALIGDVPARLTHGDLARRRAARFTPAPNGGRDGRTLHAPARPGARPECSRMRIAYFTHSLASCWNHGNAHFLRGVLRELIARGHDVRALEPADNWSLANLLVRCRRWWA